MGAALVVDPFGDREDRPAPTTPKRPPAPPPEPPPAADTGEGLSIGLTEINAPLIAHAGAEPAAPVGFGPWRERLTALRPRYFRLMVDWAALQPDPNRPPDWTRPVDGCSRGQHPCANFSGIRDVLRAVAGQQKAGAGFEVLVSLYGVPDWAALSARGCERDDAAPRSRPIADAAMPAYRALIRSLVEVAGAEGVKLPWWSPWNEPNGPFFISPQRDTCDETAPLRSPKIYTRLARAMRHELETMPGDQGLVIGELAGLPGPSLRGGGVEEFFAGLPDDVVCSADVFAQHAYAERGDDDAASAPVDQLEAALAKRPCAAEQPIWITETGIGGPKVGGARNGGEAGVRADCREMHEVLSRWDADPRVTAAFQYTFRDDPSFPVALADANLTRTWPAYDLWAAWGGEREPSAPAPELPESCASETGGAAAG